MFPKCTRPRPIVLPVKIALMSPEPDFAKAEAYFERALAVARAQRAKSWELRRFDLGFSKIPISRAEYLPSTYCG